MPLKLMMSKYKQTVRVCLLLLGICLAGSACRRDMQDQPKMKPFRGTTFFGDGLSSRQPIEGTIPRGFLRENTALFTAENQSPRRDRGNRSATPPARRRTVYPTTVDIPISGNGRDVIPAANATTSLQVCPV